MRTLLAAGVPITPAALKCLSMPEHVALFLEYGWVASEMSPENGWTAWARRDEAFYAAVLKAGTVRKARDLAVLLKRRLGTQSASAIERDHFELLLSYLSRDEIVDSFEAVDGAKTLSDAALLYLPVWGLEILLSRGAAAPSAVMTPKSPEQEAKLVLLKVHGLSVPTLDSRSFTSADCYTPEDAVRCLLTEGGLLGLRLGMSEADARALNYSDDYLSIFYESGVVSRVCYSSYDDVAEEAKPVICDALNERYEEPSVRGASIQIWETPFGRISQSSECDFAGVNFIIALEAGKTVVGVMPKDLDAFADKLLDYLKDIGPDALTTQVKTVAVQALDAGLAISGQLVNGDGVRFEWYNAPLVSNGSLDDDFLEALVGAFSRADRSY